jgi:hypothetical protein
VLCVMSCCKKKAKASPNSSFPILKMLILMSLTATSLSWRSVSEERGEMELWNFVCLLILRVLCLMKQSIMWKT